MTFDCLTEPIAVVHSGWPMSFPSSWSSLADRETWVIYASNDTTHTTEVTEMAGPTPEHALFLVSEDDICLPCRPLTETLPIAYAEFLRHTQATPKAAAVRYEMTIATPCGELIVRKVLRAYLAVPMDEDIVFSHCDLDLPVTLLSRLGGLADLSSLQRDLPELEPQPADIHAELLLGASEAHGFVEPELNEPRHNDLTIVEREIKFDATEDPRPASYRAEFGSPPRIFAGQPIPNSHYHRIYDVGTSGLFLMCDGPDGGNPLLKYKLLLDPDFRGTLLRFEAVEPYSPATFDRAVHCLDSSADPLSLCSTPFFHRDRVKTNVYLADTRNIFEVFGDHSYFLEGHYAPFNQVEIEYVGVVQRLDKPIELGRTFEDTLEMDFGRVRELVVQGYDEVGLTLSPSIRTKWDWARTEVFSTS